MSAAKQQKPITDEIATVEKDIFRDYLGKIQGNPDKFLKSESGGKGIELYEDLLRDDKVGSALQTRKLAVIGREWEVVPASDKRQDQKVADFVKDVFLNFNYDAARKMLLSGTVLGFKPGEVMWERSEGDIWVRDIIGRASRRFVFDLDGKMRMITIGNWVEGEELPDRKFIIFRNASDNGSPYGDGLGRMLYWPVWFKKNAIKFWMIFADKFGSPTAVGKYPQGTPKAQQDDLLSACEAIQQESAITIPDGLVIELLEASRQGSVNTYETLCNFMNNSIAQILLGHTGSSISTPGKLGSEDAAIDVKNEYVKADADMLCECQNRSLVKWLVDYNFPGVKKYPKVWVRTDEEKDLKPLAERDQLLVNMGVPIGQKYFYDTYGVPEPADGEKVVSPISTTPFSPFTTPQPPPKIGGGVEGSAFAEGKTFPDQLAINNLGDSMTPEELQAQMDGVLKPVIEMIQNNDSFDAIMEKLSTDNPAMDTKAMEEMLSRAIFISEVWGRMNSGN